MICCFILEGDNLCQLFALKCITIALARVFLEISFSFVLEKDNAFDSVSV